MKKAETEPKDSDIRGQYDFSGGVRGKYAHRFADRATVVLLEPDVAEVFPDTASVNGARRKRGTRP
jgi:hypothetical protein